MIDEKFEQVIQKIGPQNRLLGTWELQGGVSAQVTPYWDLCAALRPIG